VGAVAEIDKVLLGQRNEAFVQDREPADARIEDGDREICGGSQ
jgi:hypothetical protein